MSIALRAAGYQGEASVHTRALRHLARIVDGKGFSASITADLTATGRPATDLLSMTEAGELELCYFASSYLADRVPELGVLDLPFRGAGAQVLQPGIARGARLRGALEAAVRSRSGFEVLGFWDNGARHFTNSVRPLRHPRDCAGLVIRTMRSDLHQASFSALGFVPRYIDVKDYPAAVRSGAVNAQENPVTNIVLFDVAASHRFMTCTGHFKGVTLVLANAAWVRALPSRARADLDRAMIAASHHQASLASAEEAAGLAALRAAGMEIISEGDWDEDAFRAASAPVADAALARLDPGLISCLP
jgi:TRAP-type C4-dicarboxylate transport system substrate-binding protein